MSPKLTFAVLTLIALLTCMPQADARDAFGGRMSDFQRNAGNRLNDNWSRQRDSWSRNDSSYSRSDWNRSSRDTWGRGNSSRNWLHENNDRDNYSQQSNSRSPYGNIGKQDKRFDPQKMQNQWQKQWEKQVKKGEDYSEELQKKYDKITKQNSPFVSGGRRAATRYGF